MPINNDVYGVWKLLKWYDPTLLGATANYYVVETADIGTTQDIKNTPFVQGTGLPIILNVSGASASIKIKAPLIVTETPRTISRATDTVSDGYRLWTDLMSGGTTQYAADILKSNFKRETGVIFEELGFSVDSQQGCRYTINLVGDSNYLNSETGLTAGSGISLEDGTMTGTDNGVYEQPPSGNFFGPFTGELVNSRWVIKPCRVASFYDVIGLVTTGRTSISGYMEKLEITYRFSTTGFNYVGQPTQRKIMAAGAIEAQVSGTMISSERSPLGYQFPWQAMNSYDDTSLLTTSQKVPDTNPPNTFGQSYGGIVKHTDVTFQVGLRNGTSSIYDINTMINLVPGLAINNSLFQSSTQQVSSDLLRTQFSAFGWITDPLPFQ